MRRRMASGGRQIGLALADPAAAGGARDPAPSLRDWPAALWPVAPDWVGLVRDFLAGPSGSQLLGFVARRLAAGATVYPPLPLRALALTPRHAVRVVIVGQDPYHGAGQAEGLAFSVAPGVRVPPSLRNIFTERARDLGLPPPANGSLAGWAHQGVLLLNTSLTVEEGRPGSHAGRGWEVLTDAVIAAVAARGQPTAYLLWGAHAQTKRGLIAGLAPVGTALVLEANHPSPLSARRLPVPFVGCAHFSRANEWLRAQGQVAVEW